MDHGSRMSAFLPRFYALLPVRDEADIIRECLAHALEWADAVYVFDTGSVDGTYDIVREMSRQDNRVRVLGREPVYYNENRVRGLLFSEARAAMREGDWFLRLDADEFHHISPPEFVATRLSDLEGVVYHQYYNFELTAAEAERWSCGQESLEDRSRSIAERRRFFTVSEYAEPRMCRYRTSMRWPVQVSFPYNAGLVAKERLPIRHYPHRDPVQLDRRCKLRNLMMADRQNRANWTRPEHHHWAVRDWRSFVVPDDLKGLRHWKIDDALPTVHQTNHLAVGPKRAAQLAIYATGLPRILDRGRQAWKADARPLAIEQETQELLSKELAT